MNPDHLLDAALAVLARLEAFGDGHEALRDKALKIVDEALDTWPQAMKDRKRRLEIEREMNEVQARQVRNAKSGIVPAVMMPQGK